MLNSSIAHTRPQGKSFVVDRDRKGRTVMASPRRCRAPLGEATTDTAVALNQSGRVDGHHLGCCAEMVALVYRPLRKCKAALTGSAIPVAIADAANASTPAFHFFLLAIFALGESRHNYLCVSGDNLEEPKWVR